MKHLMFEVGDIQGIYEIEYEEPQCLTLQQDSKTPTKFCWASRSSLINTLFVTVYLITKCIVPL